MTCITATDVVILECRVKLETKRKDGREGEKCVCVCFFFKRSDVDS